MKSVKLWMLVAIILAGSISVLGQTQPPASAQKLRVDADGPPVRDSQALGFVEQALAALGGKDAQLQMRTTVLHGTMQLAGSTTMSSFLWEDDLSGNVPEFRKEIRSGNSMRVFVSGHGMPAQQRNDRQKQLSQQIVLAAPPLYLPGVVLARQLKDQGCSFRLINEDSDLIHIRISWDINSTTSFSSPQDWYLDPGTKLPVRVRYLPPSTQQLGHVDPASMDFSDFRVISGIAVPFKIVGHGSDQQRRTFVVTDAQTNSKIDPTHFETTRGQQ